MKMKDNSFAVAVGKVMQNNASAVKDKSLELLGSTFFKAARINPSLGNNLAIFAGASYLSDFLSKDSSERVFFDNITRALALSCAEGVSDTMAGLLFGSDGKKVEEVKELGDMFGADNLKKLEMRFSNQATSGILATTLAKEVKVENATAVPLSVPTKEEQEKIQAEKAATSANPHPKTPVQCALCAKTLQFKKTQTYDVKFPESVDDKIAGASGKRVCATCIERMKKADLKAEKLIHAAAPDTQVMPTVTDKPDAPNAKEVTSNVPAVVAPNESSANAEAQMLLELGKCQQEETQLMAEKSATEELEKRMPGNPIVKENLNMTESKLASVRNSIQCLRGMLDKATTPVKK